MRANVEHNSTLHRNVVILSIETLNVPNVPERRAGRRSTTSATATTASATSPRSSASRTRSTCPACSTDAISQGLEGDCDVAHRVLLPLAHDHRRARRDPGMRPWRKKLFMALARNASNPVAYFGLPDDRTVVMGSNVTF